MTKLNNNTLSNELGKREKRKQAGAELCQAQVKLGLAYPAIAS